MLSHLEVNGHCLYHTSLILTLFQKGVYLPFLKNINGQELLIA